jgi:hypothetical protein
MSERLTTRPTSPQELLDQPFWLLGVEPTATETEVEAAVEQAKAGNVAPEEALNAARDALLHPVDRLPYELAYPLGCPLSEVDEWHHLAAGGFDTHALLKHAAHLSALGQANFFFYFSARGAADSLLLCALIAAFSRIEPTSVYDQVRDARRLAGYPPPSLAQIHQQLATQLDTLCERTISAYGPIGEAVEPLCESVRKVLSEGERHQVHVLQRLLEAYQKATLDERSSRLADIETACDEIERNSDQRTLIDGLADALGDWVDLSRPLILYEDFGLILGEALKNPLQRLRSLIIDLALNTEYERAIEVAKFCKEKLSVISGAARLLDEAAIPAERAHRMRRDRQLAVFKSLISSCKQSPVPLVQAIQQSGFGPSGIGAANQLWQMFAETLGVIGVTKVEATEPSLEIWALARSLRGQPGGPAAERLMLEGCLKYGAQIGVPQSVVEAIRDDFDHLSRPTTPTRVQPTKPARKFFLYASGATIVLCIAAPLLLRFVQPAKALLATMTESFSRATKPSTAATIDEEKAPAVGTQQHMTLANLRYCRFQEERLLLVKPKIRSAEDMRAFNMLVVDYNSRCSDVLYRDSDSLIVQADLAKRHQQLIEEADRIASTWQELAADQPIK